MLYCLGLNDQDPIEHGLYFEQFINPLRQWSTRILLQIEDAPEKEKSLFKHLQESFKYLKRDFDEKSINGTGIEPQDVLPISGVNGTTLLYSVASEFGLLFTYHNGEIIYSSYAVPVEVVTNLTVHSLVLDNSPTTNKILNLHRKAKENGFKTQLSKLDILNKEFISNIRSGKTVLYQFGGEMVKAHLRSIYDLQLKHIVAINALYRPGLTRYLSIYEELVVKGYKKITPPVIGNSLDDTHGILIYEEQIIKLLSELGGLSFAEAEIYKRKYCRKVPKLYIEESDLYNKVFNENKVLSREDSKSLLYFIGSHTYHFPKVTALSQVVASLRLAYLESINYFQLFAIR